MSLFGWLRNIRSVLTLASGQHRPRRPTSVRTATYWPRLEVLEDRLTLSYWPAGTWPTEPPGIVWASPTPLLGDFTSDGNLNQVSIGSGVVVRPGRGDGTFGTPIRTGYPSVWGALGLVVADFNNDDRLEVLGWEYDFHQGWNIANVLLGGGQGYFNWWQIVEFYEHSFDFGTGDINRDGLTDVVFIGGETWNEHYALALLNDGNWGSSEPPPPPTPHLSIHPTAVVEGNVGAVAATFIVRLSVAGFEAITVNYATGDGSATGSDYLAASGTLTFAPGELSKTVTVLVNGDRVAEPSETFVVNLSNPVNVTSVNGQGAGTIS